MLHSSPPEEWSSLWPVFQSMWIWWSQMMNTLHCTLQQPMTTLTLFDYLLLWYVHIYRDIQYCTTLVLSCAPLTLHRSPVCNNWSFYYHLHFRPLATWMQKTIWSRWLLCAWLLNEKILELWRFWWDMGLMWTWPVLMVIHHYMLWQQTKIWRSQHPRHNSCRE